MIKADGIWAFHGTMIYSPPNPKFRKEIKGDFVHRQFDGEGYWYDGWSSYDDRFCEVHEELSAADLVEELEKRIAGLKGLVVTGENLPEIQAIIDNTETWIEGVKART